MGYRLSKIYTRTGDRGDTALGNGQRVAKDDCRVEAYGTVDELNCLLGWLLSTGVPEPLHSRLVLVQHRLFDLGAELCIPGREGLPQQHVTELEQWIDEFNAALPPLKEFILPGGPLPASICHTARAVCRRAERRVITLARHSPVSTAAIAYLNRLSDLLFVVARVLARRDGTAEQLWQPATADDSPARTGNT